MALKIKGGSFTFAKQVDAPEASFDMFFQWLNEQNNLDKLWPYHRDFKEPPNVKKQLYAFSSKNYWYGVILSGKSKLFQHVKSIENGKLTIKAIKIDGEPPLELNFFCLRKDSGKGIYSHYTGSSPFGSFINDLWACYRFFVGIQKDKAFAEKKKALDDNEDTKKFPSNKELGALYSLQGKCQHGPLYSPEKFNQLVDRLQYVEEVRLTTYDVDSEEDEPASAHLKSKREVYHLDNEMAVDQKIRRWIKSLREKAVKPLKDNSLKHTGSVFGHDFNDAPLTINFDKTMQNFIDFDYDNLGSIEIDKLLEHAIIRLMVKRLRNDTIFKVSE